MAGWPIDITPSSVSYDVQQAETGWLTDYLPAATPPGYAALRRLGSKTIFSPSKRVTITSPVWN